MASFSRRAGWVTKDFGKPKCPPCLLQRMDTDHGLIGMGEQSWRTTACKGIITLPTVCSLAHLSDFLPVLIVHSVMVQSALPQAWLLTSPLPQARVLPSGLNAKDRTSTF